VTLTLGIKTNELLSSPVVGVHQYE